MMPGIQANTIDTFAIYVKEPVVVTGEHAFARCGLTTTFILNVQCETDIEYINGCGVCFVHYYCNKNAKNYCETHPSSVNPNILVPSKERAIVDYIMYRDNFDEGILIEGLMSYLNYNKDLTKLYEVAKHLHLPKKELDYWLEEARNETTE